MELGQGWLPRLAIGMGRGQHKDGVRRCLLLSLSVLPLLPARQVRAPGCVEGGTRTTQEGQVPSLPGLALLLDPRPVKVRERHP